MVSLLALCRYLTARQVSEFLFGGSTLTARSRQVIAWRVLRRLVRRGLVALTPRHVGGVGSGSTEAGYFLTPAGLRLAATVHPDLPSRRPTRRGTFLLAHSLALADTALAFHRFARSEAGAEILAWESEWQIAVKLGGSRIVPDARLTYATTERAIDVFIELDMATEGTRFFAQKITRYIELYRDRGWCEFLPAWPLVLTVTPNEARVETLHVAAGAAVEYELAADELAECVFHFCSLPALRRASFVSDRVARIAGRDGRHPILDLSASEADE